MYLGTTKGWIGRYFGHYFGLYSGSTKVLQGFSECIERLVNSGIGGVRPYSAAVFAEYS